MNRIVYAIIAERRRANVDTGDLRSMLMLTKDEDTGEQMSDQQLRDDVLTMLVAGHETTATAPTWAWGLLDTHPEAAEACATQCFGPPLDDVTPPPGRPASPGRDRVCW
jgi:cytochrome P450